jgi:hypothetical protein
MQRAGAKTAQSPAPPRGREERLTPDCVGKSPRGNRYAAMSRLYSAFLVVASALAMAALGMLILVIIADIAKLAVPTSSPYGMNP